MKIDLGVNIVNKDDNPGDKLSDLTVLGPDSVGLPDGHVADQLAHVLHVVDVLSEQVALNLQTVRVRRKSRCCNTILFTKY